ncbi:unnamed protein product [Alopecurus aequalis]
MAVSYDVAREILVRVKDPITLFRCATACKGWCSLLVADHSFLRRCLREEACGSPPLPGFFTKLWPPVGPPAPCFVPAPGVLGPGRRFLSSFFPNLRHAGLFDYAVPLTSRHGLLLVRLDLHRAGVDHTDPSGVLLAVCDPLAGTLHELPRLEHHWNFEHKDEVGGCALLSDVDCSSSNHGDKDGLQQPRSRFFKIQDIYGSYTRSNTAMLRQHNAVVSGGAAHWLLWGATGTHTLDVSAETSDVSTTHVTSYDFHHEAPYLSVCGEGKLMVLSLRKDGHNLEIWTSHDTGRSFQASKLWFLEPWPMGTVYTCLGEKLGMMLVKDNDRNVYIADLKRGEIDEVTDWPRSNGLSRRKTVPLEIDWAGFFTSRLAAFANKCD